jgi:hypothetical protein
MYNIGSLRFPVHAPRPLSVTGNYTTIFYYINHFRMQPIHLLFYIRRSSSLAYYDD